MINYHTMMNISVAWGDLDSFQHVNNTFYFKYFESIRIKYLEKINFGINNIATGIGPILGYTSCRFKIPLKYPDNLNAVTKVIEIKKDRFVMNYAIFSENFDKCAAEGNGIIFAFDYDQKKKTNLPKNIINQIKKIDNL